MDHDAMTPQSFADHYDRGALWPAGPVIDPTGDLADAYRQSLALRTLRIGRGERAVGYKIGFTNRTIWERYRVFAPIWGPVWDTTLIRCDDGGSIALSATCQPRLEPEVVFGIAATPPRAATLEQLFEAVDWIAPGFEVVQSHCRDWRFTAAQTVADGALHARLLVGRTKPIRDVAADGTALDALLAATRLRLYRGDALVDEGSGDNVLDGPLHALLHFVHELERCPGAPCLMPGDVVTTGTWTDAWPVEPGQVWHTTSDGPVPSLRITLR